MKFEKEESLADLTVFAKNSVPFRWKHKELIYNTVFYCQKFRN